MVVNDQATLAVLDVGEAVARGQAFCLAILGVGERVVAGIDRCVAIHTDQLIAKGDLEARQDLEGRYKIVS
jgi:hypothetical protein